jgi:hypothetical protein
MYCPDFAIHGFRPGKADAADVAEEEKEAQ